MRWINRGTSAIAAAGVMVLGLSLLTPVATAAQAPANDHWQGATKLKLGATVTEDTTNATTDKVDARANKGCGAPFTKASVWFSYTPRSTGRYTLDMSKSDYSGGFMVFRGRPTASSLVGCQATGVAFRGKQGVKYYAVAFSDTRRNGGTLVVTLDRLHPPQLDVTVDPTATIEDSGDVTVTGSFSCRYADYVSMGVELGQPVGRFEINGSGYVEIQPATCDGSSQPFSATVTPYSGRFGGGKAVATVYATACSAFACTDKPPLTVDLQMRHSPGGSQ